MTGKLFLHGISILKIFEETFFNVAASNDDCFYFCPCFYCRFKDKHLNIDASIFLQEYEA